MVTKRLFFVIVWLLSLSINLLSQVHIHYNNQCEDLKLHYFENGLDVTEVLKMGNGKIIIQQNSPSSLSGSSLRYLSNSSFSFITMPLDSIDIGISENGAIALKFSNNGNVYRARELEFKLLSSFIEGKYWSKINKARAVNSWKSLKAAYQEGIDNHERRADSLYELVSDNQFKVLRAAVYRTMAQTILLRQILTVKEVPKGEINGCVNNLFELSSTSELKTMPVVYQYLSSAVYQLCKSQILPYTPSYLYRYFRKSLSHYLYQKQVLFSCLQAVRSKVELDSLAEDYVKMFPDKTSVEQVRNYRIHRFAVANDVEYTSLKNIAGDEVLLDKLIDSFKGKVVLIDLWASWCAPCIAELPYSKKLKKQFPTVEVLNFSIDKTSEAWMNAVDKYELTNGMNYLLLGNYLIYEHRKMKIIGVPRYLIVDAKGHIVNDDAPRPSTSLLQKYLSDLLISK